MRRDNQQLSFFSAPAPARTEDADARRRRQNRERQRRWRVRHAFMPPLNAFDQQEKEQER
jgi:hypothetical protein